MTTADLLELCGEPAPVALVMPTEIQEHIELILQNLPKLRLPSGHPWNYLSRLRNITWVINDEEDELLIFWREETFNNYIETLGKNHSD